MTSILNYFEICSKIPQKTKNNIKSFCVFRQGNIIFVTKDERVFCLGLNDFGLFGLGHEKRLKNSLKSKSCRERRLRTYFQVLIPLFCWH